MSWGGSIGVPANVQVAQKTLSTNASQIGSTRSTRTYMTIKNTDTSITIYIGASNVTNAGVNGMEIKAGESITWRSSADIYAVASSGSPVINFIDYYN